MKKNGSGTGFSEYREYERRVKRFVLRIYWREPTLVFNCETNDNQASFLNPHLRAARTGEGDLGVEALVSRACDRQAVGTTASTTGAMACNDPFDNGSRRQEKASPASRSLTACHPAKISS